jgi:hypothetical protein
MRGRRPKGARVALAVIFAAVLLRLATPGALAMSSEPCQPPPEDALAAPEGRQPERRTCPQLGSQLAQLAAAADPEAFSAQSGLAYQALVGARALIELRAEEADLAAAYGLTVESRYAEWLQAWVPLDQLCALSNDPRVQSVDAPQPPTF